MAKKKMKQRETPATLAGIRFENQFDQLASLLRDERYALVQERPLVFWTRPADRRLPLVFLDWPLRRLLKLRFDQVHSTPGVGTKKIVGLLELMERIVAGGDTSAGEPTTADEGPATESESNGNPPFDPHAVSEAQWQQWCETLRRHELLHLPIGRVARSLNEVPMVVWDTKLGKYNGHTLAEIRAMKTHGPKRVRIVLEAFWTVHCALCEATLHDHVRLELTPRFARRLEAWIDGQLASDKALALGELRNGLAKPLLEQLEVDLGERIARLVSSRLGLDGAAESVRNQAEKVGVTRARVYQWLDECANVMQVRWPAGRWKLRLFRDKLAQQTAADKQRELLATIGDIFFPGL